MTVRIKKLAHMDAQGRKAAPKNSWDRCGIAWATPSTRIECTTPSNILDFVESLGSQRVGGGIEAGGKTD